MHKLLPWHILLSVDNLYSWTWSYLTSILTANNFLNAFLKIKQSNIIIHINILKVHIIYFNIFFLNIISSIVIINSIHLNFKKLTLIFYNASLFCFVFFSTCYLIVNIQFLWFWQLFLWSLFPVKHLC